MLLRSSLAKTPKFLAVDFFKTRRPCPASAAGCLKRSIFSTALGMVNWAHVSEGYHEAWDFFLRESPSKSSTASVRICEKDFIDAGAKLWKMGIRE